MSKGSNGTPIRISDELLEIFEKIRNNVSYNTWDAEEKLSYYKCSKILAARVRKANIY
jgi:hypothetical protein